MGTTAATVAVPARIHLAGNPSDGYGGAVLSAVVTDLVATVTARPSTQLTVAGPPLAWESVAALAADVARHGHDGGDRLVTAALAVLARLLPPGVDTPPLALAWDTAIPRSVGLGGSSAIVIATLRAALAAWALDVPDHELAEAALHAETDELAIAAGLADRAAQVRAATVLTDCRTPTPTVTTIAPARPVEVLVCWSADAAAPSGAYHGGLRRVVAAGGPEAAALQRAMTTLAGLADDAAGALVAGDEATLGQAMDASLDGRLALGPVPAAATAPVEGLRAQGASVNFAGSGGALVVTPADATPPAGWSHRRVVVR